ncbi:MucR family transcriptional regulator [Novosphingobium bradum]|uniref:MucR family transcriptional regulator n=1 Tax=Novosphingobium bradum TaxID=1737444 RepID=A0ABV7IMT5_9SPHN
MDREAIITLTADIVSSYVSNNPLETKDIPQVIQSIAVALEAVKANEAILVPPVPAVDVKRAIKPGAVTCLDCGRVMKSLKQHLRLAHDLTPEGYRARWGLKPDAPIVAPDYSARRKQIALDHQLGHKAAA